MTPKDTLLPLAYSQKPVPFIKPLRKYLPLVLISVLLTLSLVCYVFVPQIRISTNFPQTGWQSLLVVDPTSSATTANNDIHQYSTSSDVNETVWSELRASRPPLVLPSGADPNATVRAQRDFVKEMMRHSWDNYAKYAWGMNELKPLSREGHSSDIFGGDTRLGATIVDSLDTLYIMNMTDEFNYAREWVASNLTFSTVNSPISVFETTIRFVAGLLSAYAFSNDPMFLQKARHVADRMLPAFNTPTGLPLALVNPMTGQSQNYAWASGGASILAEFGALHLEFVYLSYATNDTKYKEKVIKIREVMDKMVKPYNGLYLNYVNPYTGQWGDDQINIGALGDSFYEYLIKSWFQLNGTDVLARTLYDNAVDAIDRRLVQKSWPSNLTYLAKMNNGYLEHKMEHLACFSGGMFGIGAQNLTDEHKREHFMQLAANLTQTCAQSYLRTATRIGPEAFLFTDRYEAMAANNHEINYILRPEVVESYFYLWRLTHEQRYRDYAWSAAQAISRHCRTSTGFSGIANVTNIHSAKDDVQQTFFLAETLKYLYLIFSTDDLISLNHWVFNTEAHPFPVLPGIPVHHNNAV